MYEIKEDTIKVLIVEDEPILAELNAEFIQRDTKVEVIGIASSLEEAKVMVEKLKPTLILLDNYLPEFLSLQQVIWIRVVKLYGLVLLII